MDPPSIHPSIHSAYYLIFPAAAYSNMAAVNVGIPYSRVSIISIIHPSILFKRKDSKSKPSVSSSLSLLGRKRFPFQRKRKNSSEEMRPHANASSANVATYTTIPIAPTDVISRSIQNLSSYFSLLLRPRTQFLPSAFTGFDRPPSLSSAKSRFLKNASYFRLNYVVILLCCALLSLLQTPLSLLLVSALCFLWSVLYLFREDPLFLWGRHLTDRTLLIALSFLSLIFVWGILGVFWNLTMGLAAGATICALHGILRNGEGLAMDECEAASEGLISAAPSPQAVDRRVAAF